MKLYNKMNLTKSHMTTFSLCINEKKNIKVEYVNSVIRQYGAARKKPAEV